MAVVKADGYGHGMVRVAQLALEEGAEMIGVAIPEEAFELRQAGVSEPVMVLGYTPPSAIVTAVRLGITMTVFSIEIVCEISKVCERLNRRANVHLKLNTGMSRLGITSEIEATELAQLILQSRQIVLEGVFTHFACAAEDDSTMTESQFTKFMTLVEVLEQGYGPIPIKHCCNTAAMLKFPHMHQDMVRVGIGLYGLNPLNHPHAEGKAFTQAMSLKTEIVHIVPLAANESVSYGATFRTKRDSRIAVIPIGYADGLPRELSNKGIVLVNGRRAPIIGIVCMDQTMLDVTDVEDASIGSEVVLFGHSSTGHLLLAGEQADHAGTIHYEIVTRVGMRVPRVWI